MYSMPLSSDVPVRQNKGDDNPPVTYRNSLILVALPATVMQNAVASLQPIHTDRRDVTRRSSCVTSASGGVNWLLLFAAIGTACCSGWLSVSSAVSLASVQTAPHYAFTGPPNIMNIGQPVSVPATPVIVCYPRQQIISNDFDCAHSSQRVLVALHAIQLSHRDYRLTLQPFVKPLKLHFWLRFRDVLVFCFR